MRRRVWIPRVEYRGNVLCGGATPPTPHARWSPMNNWQARYGQEHSYQESGLESLADLSPPGGKKCTCFKSKSLDIIGNNRIALGGKNPILLIHILTASA